MARRRRINHTLKQIRERRYKLRARTTRFLPDSDSGFAHMARCFAEYCEKHAERLRMSAEQVKNLNTAVMEFRDALARTMNPRTCGPFTTMQKNTARAKAKDAIRAVAAVLRGWGNEVLTPADRLVLNINERPKKTKRRECPDIAPVLRFVRAVEGLGVGSGRHVLEYRNDFDYVKGAKPHGAARVELFVELVPPELARAGKIPARPGDLRGGVHWYLRSFTTSRFEIEFPVKKDGSPALVVYWGRWADACGGVGPFSQTCVARVEGGVVPALPMFAGVQRAKSAKSGGQIRVDQAVHYLEAKQVMFASEVHAALPAGGAEREFEPATAPAIRLLNAA